MNQNKRRRLDKADKPKGPSGQPHPFGSRQYRRSKEGKAEIEVMFQKWAAGRELGLNKEEILIPTALHTHPMNEVNINDET